MKHTFQLLLPSPVVVGGGVSQSLPDHARRLGLQRVLVVTDEYLLENGHEELELPSLRELMAEGIVALYRETY